MGVRRERDPRDHARGLRATRCWTADQGGPRSAPPSGGRPRPRLPVPRLRASTRMVRCTPRAALGRRWADRAGQSRPALPAAPPSDPPGFRRRDGGRLAPVHAAGRHRTERPRSAVGVATRAFGPPRLPSRSSRAALVRSRAVAASRRRPRACARASGRAPPSRSRKCRAASAAAGGLAPPCKPLVRPQYSDRNSARRLRAGPRSPASG